MTALPARCGSVDAGFTPHDEPTPDQVKELAVVVDALSQPPSRLTTTVPGS